MSTTQALLFWWKSIKLSLKTHRKPVLQTLQSIHPQNSHVGDKVTTAVMKCLPLKYSEAHAYGRSWEGGSEPRRFVTLTNLVLLQNSAPLGPAGQAIPVHMKYVSMVIIKSVLRCGEKIHEIRFSKFPLDNQETTQELGKEKERTGRKAWSNRQERGLSGSNILKINKIKTEKGDSSRERGGGSHRQTSEALRSCCCCSQTEAVTRSYHKWHHVGSTILTLKPNV